MFMRDPDLPRFAIKKQLIESQVNMIDVIPIKQKIALS